MNRWWWRLKIQLQSNPGLCMCFLVAPVKQKIQHQNSLPHTSGIMSEKARYEAQIAELQQKLETSCRRQHEIENILEEYEVAKNRQSHQAKELNKKFYDLQKKYVIADKERKDLVQKMAALEKEKKTATERWVRATSQAKQDDKFKCKPRII